VFTKFLLYTQWLKIACNETIAQAGLSNLLVSCVRAVYRLGWAGRGQQVFTTAPAHPLPVRCVGGVDVNEGKVNELLQAILRGKPLTEHPASLG